MIGNILIVLGVALAIYGLLGLLGTWWVPEIGSSRLYGPNMLTGRMKPNRANKTIMALWYLFIGAYLTSSSSGHRALSYAFLAAFMVCAVIAMVIRYRHSG